MPGYVSYESDSSKTTQRVYAEFRCTFRKGFEILIGVELDETWWRLAEFPAKYGGISLRSGLKTFRAQHLCLLAKSTDNVGRIVGGWTFSQLLIETRANG